jgi:hypothetical protein
MKRRSKRFLAAEETTRAESIPGELRSTDRIGPDRIQRDAAGKTEVSSTVETLSHLHSHLDELRKRAEAVPREARTLWELDRSLDLAIKAQESSCERALLEMLLRSHTVDSPKRLVRYSGWEMTEKTIIALAWVILEKNLSEDQKQRFLHAPKHGRPGDVRGLLMSWRHGWVGDFFGTALAAIDSYEDERASALLLELGLKKAKPGAPSQASASIWALRFLRCYEGEQIIAKLKATAGRASTELAYAENLASCLDAIEYAASLEPSAQERYRHIQRILWRAGALAWQYTRKVMTLSYALEDILSDWNEGDERFIPQMLKATRRPGGHEWNVTGNLIRRGPISETRLAWLKEQAKSPEWPEEVRNDLIRVLSIRSSEELRREEKDPR